MTQKYVVYTEQTVLLVKVVEAADHTQAAQACVEDGEPWQVHDGESLRGRWHASAVELPWDPETGFTPRWERNRKGQLVPAQEAHKPTIEDIAEHHDGLHAYAESIPAFKRAAVEGYPVGRAALGHYVETIAELDPEATIHESDDVQYKRCKFTDRENPSAHAFRVLDSVREHVERTPRPQGVNVVIDRIVQAKMAYRDRHGRWRTDAPQTMVRVLIEMLPSAGVHHIILFLADDMDRRTHELEEEEILIPINGVIDVES